MITCWNSTKIKEGCAEYGTFAQPASNLYFVDLEGNTKEEAMANIKEAIELYLEPVEDDLTVSPDHEITEIAI